MRSSSGTTNPSTEAPSSSASIPSATGSRSISADAALAQAGQDIGVSTQQLSQAEARLVEERANYAAATDVGQRTLELVQRGVYPAARGVEAREQMNAAAASVDAAEASVSEARERLGPEGAENPQIRSAAAALERARRDLHDTTVVAPSRGIITDRRITAGQFAPAGQRLMTFIEIEAGWVAANITERSLENVAPGNPVEIAIDLYPGRIFRGSVESWTWGVAPRAEPTAATHGLPSLRTQQSGWLRETQEFPVRIRFELVPYPKGIRVGAQASVIIYTESNQVMNALGWLWIRLVTLFAYVY